MTAMAGAAGIPLLELSALTAGYTAPVVGPVDLVIRPGERIGIAGPNGAGKSTLLQAIAGTARLFSGTRTTRSGLRLAHQAQRPPATAGLPLSGRELLALTGAGCNGLPPWLESVLDERLDQRSGGQLQFLYLWMALHAGADLVLLDEPANNLDPRSEAALEALLLAGGPAILLVSHDTAFLERTCQRLLHLPARRSE